MIPLLAALGSCQNKTELTRGYLEGDWEFLGSWEDSKFQFDTLFYLAPSDDPDIYFYDIITDTGIWKCSVLKKNQKVIHKELIHYQKTFTFMTDTGGYFHEKGADPLNADEPRFIAKLINGNGTLDFIPLDSMHIPYYDNRTARLYRVPGDTLKIVWLDGTVSKYKKLE